MLEIIEGLLGLLPTIINTVKAVEAVVPQQGAGEQKLNAVLSTVQAAAQVAPALTAATSATIAGAQAGNSANIASGLTLMINAVVALFNATGTFQKSGVVQAITASNAPPPVGG